MSLFTSTSFRTSKAIHAILSFMHISANNITRFQRLTGPTRSSTNGFLSKLDNILIRIVKDLETSWERGTHRDRCCSLLAAAHYTTGILKQIAPHRAKWRNDAHALTQCANLQPQLMFHHVLALMMTCDLICMHVAIAVFCSFSCAHVFFVCFHSPHSSDEECCHHRNQSWWVQPSDLVAEHIASHNCCEWPAEAFDNMVRRTLMQSLQWHSAQTSGCGDLFPRCSRTMIDQSVLHLKGVHLTEGLNRNMHDDGSKCWCNLAHHHERHDVIGWSAAHCASHVQCICHAPGDLQRLTCNCALCSCNMMSNATNIEFMCQTCSLRVLRCADVVIFIIQQQKQMSKFMHCGACQSVHCFWKHTWNECRQNDNQHMDAPHLGTIQPSPHCKWGGAPWLGETTHMRATWSLHRVIFHLPLGVAELRCALRAPHQTAPADAVSRLSTWKQCMMMSFPTFTALVSFHERCFAIFVASPSDVMMMLAIVVHRTWHVACEQWPAHRQWPRMALRCTQMMQSNADKKERKPLHTMNENVEHLKMQCENVACAWWEN